MPAGGTRTATTRSHTRPSGSGRRVLRGLLALVLLLAMVVGIPVVLLAVGSMSYLGGFADVPRLIANLTAPDDGSLFLGVLTLTAWIGWATFSFAVVLEIPAQLRGVPTVRLRGIGIQQSVAGSLVAAVLAVVVLPGAASAVEPSVKQSVAASRPVRISSQHDVAAAAHPKDPLQARQGEPDADAGGVTYEVRRGDTLWDIAAERLGDGSQWRRIAHLNYDRAQPDGGRLERSHRLQPGWHLLLPEPSAQERHGAGARVHVVKAGETLSGIAREELGSGDRWPEILDASTSVVEPGGARLTDPDRIYPGWTVRLPEDGALAERISRTDGASAPSRSDTAAAGGSEDTVQGETPDPSRSQPLEGSSSAPTGGPPEAAAGRASVSPYLEATPVSADEGDDDDLLLADVADVRTLGGVGGLLAACIVLLVGARRARQQRRRQPGQRISLPPPSVLATEARLRFVADVAGVKHIDLALRALAAEHRCLGRPLPGMRYVRLTRRHLELYLAEAAPLPAPWTPTSDPTVWALPHEDLTAQGETDTRAPYPALVTIGHDLEDAHVLLDLEQPAALAIEGDRDATLPLLAGVAVELATSPWADDLLVTLVGCFPELPGTVATGRLRHVDRIEQLIAELEGRAADVQRVLLEAGVPDLAVARGTGVADDAWPPEIVILADDVPRPLRDRLERVLYGVPRVGVAAVTAGAALGEWRLCIDAAAGRARLDPVGLVLRPQRLDGPEYADVLQLLAEADAAPVAGPSWASELPTLEQALADLRGPDPATDMDAPEVPHSDVELVPPPVADAGRTADHTSTDGADGTAAADVASVPGRAPYVRVLGPVDVVGALGPEPVTLKEGRAVASHLARATALVAYLACRPGGATIEQVSEALSPVRRLTPNTIWSLASRTRKWLGSDPHGEPYFPRTSHAGTTMLHAAVGTDWSDWLDLVGTDVTERPLPRLLEALALVRGRPFEGVSERHYVWADPLRQEMVAGIVDVVHEVVRRALLIPDVGAARKALRVGRLVDPTNELLWRDALRIEYVGGTHESRKRLVEQLYAFADDLETDLEPETEELIGELERTSGRRAAAQ
jgi:nucleoid-associated protein YgaU